MFKRNGVLLSVVASAASAGLPAISAPAQPARRSKESQLQELDRLAAGGYITPQEYKERRQAGLSSN